MDTETLAAAERTVPSDVYNHLLTVARGVYAGGYLQNTMSYAERNKLRASAYRALKALGLER